jgi:phosphoribosylanthranilate isomerase
VPEPSLPSARELPIKICGLTQIEDARMAARAGATYLGAVLSRGFRRSVEPGLAARYPDEAGRPLVAVLVDETPSRAAQLARATGATILQLHGAEPPRVLESLRELGEWQIWKALRVRRAEEVIEAIERYQGLADALLLDGWHPEHRGGSGARFPWDLVEPVRDRFPPGLMLVAAGGLQPSIVAEAVRRLRPDVVDVSSGVEIRPGIKDPGRVRAFIRNARGAHDAPPDSAPDRDSGPSPVLEPDSEQDD